MNHSRAGIDRCAVCEARALYRHQTYANGAHGPRLLDKLGRLFHPTKMDVFVCAECGHISLFADAEARKALKESFAWKEVK